MLIEAVSRNVRAGMASLRFIKVRRACAKVRRGEAGEIIMNGLALILPVLFSHTAPES